LNEITDLNNATGLERLSASKDGRSSLGGNSSRDDYIMDISEAMLLL